MDSRLGLPIKIPTAAKCGMRILLGVGVLRLRFIGLAAAFADHPAIKLAVRDLLPTEIRPPAQTVGAMIRRINVPITAWRTSFCLITSCNALCLGNNPHKPKGSSYRFCIPCHRRSGELANCWPKPEARRTNNRRPHHAQLDSYYQNLQSTLVPR